MSRDANGVDVFESQIAALERDVSSAKTAAACWSGRCASERALRLHYQRRCHVLQVRVRRLRRLGWLGRLVAAVTGGRL